MQAFGNRDEMLTSFVLDDADLPDDLGDLDGLPDLCSSDGSESMESGDDGDFGIIGGRRSASAATSTAQQPAPEPEPVADRGQWKPSRDVLGYKVLDQASGGQLLLNIISGEFMNLDATAGRWFLCFHAASGQLVIGNSSGQSKWVTKQLPHRLVTNDHGDLGFQHNTSKVVVDVGQWKSSVLAHLFLC